MFDRVLNTPRNLTNTFVYVTITSLNYRVNHQNKSKIETTLEN